MLFNSFEFLVFFVLVVLLFFVLPRRVRWMLLLASSYVFYMSWKPFFIILIVGVTATSYTTGILLSRTVDAAKRKLLLAASIIIHLGLLFTFKYVNFFSQSLASALVVLRLPVDMPVLHIALPVGMSFYTLQSLGYTIDVYRGRQSAERHYGIYSLYVAFFPQLVAGPIERAQSLLPQFYHDTSVECDRFRSGFERAMWGLFKKVVVADLLAGVVERVYATPTEFPGPILLLATVFFAVQIYCDFSGYSDIAIGTARILGYELMDNFRMPYFADSIADFWRRWHISLSTWFRDYVYIPLGGNRVSSGRWYANIMAVFVLSGLWHGANWTFVVWGALHGFYFTFGSLTETWRTGLARLIRLNRMPTFQRLLRTASVLVLVLVGWVFFRAASVSDAMYILLRILSIRGFRIADLWSLGLPRFEMILAFVTIGILFSVEFMMLRPWMTVSRVWEKPVLRRMCYCACIYWIVCFGVFDKVQFIYFQF